MSTSDSGFTEHSFNSFPTFGSQLSCFNKEYSSDILLKENLEASKHQTNSFDSFLKSNSLCSQKFGISSSSSTYSRIGLAIVLGVEQE